MAAGKNKPAALTPRDWTKIRNCARRLAEAIADPEKLATRSDRREAYNDAKIIFEIADPQDARYRRRQLEKDLGDNEKLPSFDEADTSEITRTGQHTDTVRRVDRVKQGRKIIEKEVEPEHIPLSAQDLD